MSAVLTAARPSSARHGQRPSLDLQAALHRLPTSPRLPVRLPVQSAPITSPSQPPAPVPTPINPTRDSLALRFLLPAVSTPACAPTLVSCRPQPRQATGSPPSPWREEVLPVYPLPSLAAPPPVQPVSSQWAAQLVRGIAEVMAGQRGATQLLSMVTLEVHTYLRSCTFPHLSAPNAGPCPPGRVRSLHITQPSETAAELCATVCFGSRYCALAIRLDHSAGRWRCTHLCTG